LSLDLWDQLMRDAYAAKPIGGLLWRVELHFVVVDEMHDQLRAMKHLPVNIDAIRLSFV
jgi:hypothetical protein